MNKLLVFGATGLVGSNLIEHFKKNSSVTGSFRSNQNFNLNNYDDIEYNYKNYNLDELNLSDYNEIHYTIHSPHSDDRLFSEKLNDNFFLYYNLVQLLCDINYEGRLVYYSTEGIDRMSDFQYGSNQFEYAYTHLKCENLKLFESTNLFIDNIRLPNLYGFNHFSNTYSGLICYFLESAFKFRKIELLSDGLEIRGMCNIEPESNLGLQTKYFPHEKLFRVKCKKYNIITFATICAIAVDGILGGRTSLLVKGIDKPTIVDKNHSDIKLLFENIKYIADKMQSRIL
jgi:nucleoside-diphosphate-sugar epimerase